MTTALTLRPYQVEALDNLEADWATGLRCLGVSSATGTGKTVMMAHLAHAYQQGRVLILVHREELLQQTVDKLRRRDRGMSIGRVKGALNETGARIVVASVQTAAHEKRLRQLGHFGLIIVDEAHRSMANSYLTIFSAYPSTRMAGFSATWSRSDNRGLGDLWQKISFEYSIGDAVANGDLVRPRGIYIETSIDLDNVKVTAGDYNDKAVGEQLDDDSILKAIIQAWTDHAADRQGVVFAPTVASGEMFREGLTAAGFPTEGLYGVTGKDASAAIHKRFERGQTQLLVSCTRLAEGWDAPWCSAGILARPTLHTGFFIQMIGRLLRLCPQCNAPCEHKRDAIILDPMGNLYRHDLHGVIDLSESPPPREKDDDENEDDLDEEELDEPAPLADFRRAGRVVGYEEVDLLFDQTDVRWLKTHAGMPFVPLRHGAVFVVPSKVSQLVRVGQYTRHLDNGDWVTDWVTTDEAMAAASAYAKGKVVAYRTLGAAPSRDQVLLCRTQGINAGGAATRGEMQDAIDIAVASRQLDAVLWTQVDVR